MRTGLCSKENPTISRLSIGETQYSTCTEVEVHNAISLIEGGSPKSQSLRETNILDFFQYQFVVLTRHLLQRR